MEVMEGSDWLRMGLLPALLGDGGGAIPIKEKLRPQGVFEQGSHEKWMGQLDHLDVHI